MSCHRKSRRVPEEPRSLPRDTARRREGTTTEDTLPQRYAEPAEHISQQVAQLQPSDTDHTIAEMQESVLLSHTAMFGFTSLFGSSVGNADRVTTSSRQGAGTTVLIPLGHGQELGKASTRKCQAEYAFKVI